jgi:peptidoglycan/xylan/chitin deacetylase (PgdA/CDA1 family)
MNRRALNWGLALGSALVALGGISWAASNARCYAIVGRSICRVETDRKLVALTLDDGPTRAGVEASLPVLEAHGARATFFLIGEEVAQRPHLVRSIVEAGHEVANHSYSHDWMIGRPSSWYDAEIGRTHQLLIQAGAPPPRYFRPPYGKKLWGLPTALRRHGYRLIMIDVEEPDVQGPSDYAARLVDEVKPGSIILMHLMYRANGTARAALPLVLEGLSRRGFQVVTVGELERQARSHR